MSSKEGLLICKRAEEGAARITRKKFGYVE